MCIYHAYIFMYARAYMRPGPHHAYIRVCTYVHIYMRPGPTMYMYTHTFIYAYTHAHLQGQGPTLYTYTDTHMHIYLNVRASTRLGDHPGNIYTGYIYIHICA